MARSTQASLEASRKKAGLAAAAKLEAAADALNAYMRRASRDKASFDS